MNNENQQNNGFVAGGGWDNDTVEKEEKLLVRGFRYYFIWNIVLLIVATPIIYLHLTTSDIIFTFEGTGICCLVFFILQLYLAYELIQTRGTRTRIEMQKYDVPKHDNPKNLY